MYFKLVMENGHLGAGKSLETVRYFRGESPVEMFHKASRVPRVKGKDRATGVKLVQAVSREEYIRGLEHSTHDSYLNSRKKKRGNKRKKVVLYH